MLEEIIAGIIVVAIVMIIGLSAAISVSEAQVKQKLIQEKTSEHISLIKALGYPNSYFTPCCDKIN